MAANGFTREALQQYADSERAPFETALKELVEIPTVSVDPARKADVARGAEYAAGLLRRFGADTRIVPTPGHPIVIGRFQRNASWPTVTLYNHLDVQPAEMEDGWDAAPFQFAASDGRYYGRGTTDDKGPALSALWGARYALQHGARINLQVLWELEEEIGSPNFESTIRKESEALKTDTAIVSDTVWVSRNRPACPAGLRGLQGFRFTLEFGKSDQHSGVTGGAARNPVTEICSLIAECVDGRTGKVKIPGFYKDVVPPTKQELADMKRSGFTTAGFKKDHHFKSIRVSDPLEIMKRVWCLPTFEVHGIAGGYQGPGVKTVVPPRATAIVSCRLVPEMKESKVIRLVRDFVKKKNPDVQVEAEHGLPAYRGRTTGPHADAIRASMKFAFGREPSFVREGGSIGAVLSMERVLKAPVYFLGLSLPEHGYHAPNENYDWSQASGGMAAFADYFRRIGEMA
jgi:acetylornithine deacetylase/succinyl-diaminopimelate desuccinylase-like protein